MKRILVLVVVTMTCTFGIVATSQQPQHPQRPQYPASTFHTPHKKVSVAEYRDLLTAINKLYGFGKSNFSSVEDSIEVTPEMVRQYVYCMEKFYFYNLLSRDTSRVMPDYYEAF